MKSAVTILLMVIILVQAFGKWIVILEYQINKDYIAKNLCVNKTTPGSCCKGKCFLQKKLGEEGDQQQGTGKSLHAEDNSTDLFLYEDAKAEFRLLPSMQKHNSPYLTGKAQEFISSFFQPPKC